MPPTKYFLYARKSTEEEDRQIMSIEAQIQELNEFAKREKLVIAEQFIESQSAQKPGRKVFNEMIKKIHRLREPVGIISWHPDRLARNSIDGGQIIYLIDTGKLGALRFPQFWFEPTPQGLFMLQIAFGQSKYFSDNLSQNVKRGIREKLRRGEWLARAPFGYVNDHKTKTIALDPAKAKIVAQTFAEFATGTHTLDTIAEKMGEWGALSKNKRLLSRAQVEHLLTNTVYTGMIQHGKEIFPGKFPAIITPELFEQVQSIVQSRAKKSTASHEPTSCHLNLNYTNA